VLDNPIWHSLVTDHARFARGGDAVRAYPPEVAPFAAVARDGDAPSAHELREALGDADVVYFAHQMPELDGSVVTEACAPIVQMTWTPRPFAARPGGIPPIRALGNDDLDGMIDLTARVFPGYFRKRTPEMGRYVGIVEDGRLAAMGGERLSMTGYREVSAICTDPSFTGRGYARAIVAHIVSRLADEGITPFLHVNAENARARAIYESLGFSNSRDVRLLRVRTRPPA
jgi:ribosomal protein S18 acetylase RimI-like enzyme